MMNALRIFRIRREERWLAVATLLMAVTLNALLLSSHWASFTKGVKGGFWALLVRPFAVSGYDCWSWVTISNLRIHFESTRHPLYFSLLWPLHALNRWLIDVTGVNFATLLMAALLVVAAVYAAIFMYRISRELVGLPHRQALLMVGLLFSLGHVMLPYMVPDHFAFSMTLLTMTAYICGKLMQKGRRLHAWQTALLLFFTTGIAASNGLKTIVASLLTDRRAFFRPANLMGGIFVPLLMLLAIQRHQYYAFEVPQKQTIDKIVATNEKKMSEEKKKKQAEHKKLVEQHGMVRAADDGLLYLMDFSTPRLPVVVENYLGEGLLLHEDYALHDVFTDRPPIVSYRHWWSYAIIAVLALLWMAGLWAGRRNRLVQLLAAWWAMDVGLNLVLGFAINEVYIMTSGWAIIIPASIGCLLSTAPPRWKNWIEGAVLFLALYLWVHNGSILADYFGFIR